MTSENVAGDDYQDIPSSPFIAFLPNPVVWFAVWVIWIWGTIWLYMNNGQAGLLIGLSAGLAYHVYAYESIDTAEKAIGIFQGRSTTLCYSGPAFVLKPFYSLPYKWRYPTKVQVIDTDPINIVTSAGDYANGYHSAAVTKNRFSVFFKWSNDKHEMLQAVEHAPNPKDKNGLKDFLGKAVNDAMRQVGGGKTWLEMVQMGYAAGPIQQVLKGTGMIVTKVVNLDTQLPGPLDRSLTLPEESIYSAKASLIIREAVVAFLKKEGHEAMEYEKMRTIVETAEKGNLMLLSFPQQIYAAIQSGTGGQNPQQALRMSTAEMNREIARIIRRELRSGRRR